MLYVLLHQKMNLESLQGSVFQQSQLLLLYCQSYEIGDRKEISFLVWAPIKYLLFSNHNSTYSVLRHIYQKSSSAADCWDFKEEKSILLSILITHMQRILFNFLIFTFFMFHTVQNAICNTYIHTPLLKYSPFILWISSNLFLTLEFLYFSTFLSSIQVS